MKDICGFEGLYKITEDGLVWSLRKNKYLSHSLAGAGYCQLILRKDGINYNRYIHRLVMENYSSDWDPSLDVNHINGIKTDNSLSNLQMVTKSQNTQHGYDNGLLHKNERHYKTSLTISDALYIKYGFPTLSHREVGLIYNIKPKSVYKIRTEKTWRGI